MISLHFKLLCLEFKHLLYTEYFITFFEFLANETCRTFAIEGALVVQRNASPSVLARILRTRSLKRKELKK